MFIVKIRINDEIISITETIPCHFQTSSVTLRNAQTPWRDEISTFWQRLPKRNGGAGPLKPLEHMHGALSAWYKLSLLGFAYLLE